jgi:hypothetical protein
MFTRGLPVALALLAAAVSAMAVGTGVGSTAVPQGLPAIECQGNSQGRTIVSEDFEDFAPDEWVAGGSAAWQSASENFLLAPAQFQQAGRLFWATRLSGCAFRAEFDLEMSGGSGADGMTLAVVDYTDYDPAIGGGMDFCLDEEDGFAASFDSFFNGGAEPPGEHVAALQGCAGNELASALAAVRGQHHAVVDWVEGRLTINLDGSEVLTYTFPGMTFFDGFIGFTAATGGSTDNHIVDNFTLTVVNPLQGDLDCSGVVDGVDALAPLLFAQELPFEQDLPCPPLDVPLSGGFLFADVNCDGAIDEKDTMAILALVGRVAGAPVEGCVPIGEPL